MKKPQKTKNLHKVKCSWLEYPQFVKATSVHTCLNLQYMHEYVCTFFFIIDITSSIGIYILLRDQQICQDTSTR